MSQFTTTQLTNERVLVRGSDVFGTEGQCIVYSGQWSEVKARQAHSSAVQDFEAAVEEFFAPLTDAADKLETARAPKQDDPSTYVVLNEGSDGEAPVDREVVNLNRDSIILRLIESGESDRLVWVGDDLEVLAIEEPPADGDVLGDADQPEVAEGNQLSEG